MCHTYTEIREQEAGEPACVLVCVQAHARANLCGCVSVCMVGVTPPTETFTFHPDGSQGSIMHQPTDGWLSLLSFVASPHHFPGQSIRKQRWKREMETEKDRMTEEGNKERGRVDVYSSGSPRPLPQRLKKKWKVKVFLSQSVCVYLWWKNWVIQYEQYDYAFKELISTSIMSDCTVFSCDHFLSVIIAEP